MPERKEAREAKFRTLSGKNENVVGGQTLIRELLTGKDMTEGRKWTAISRSRAAKKGKATPQKLSQTGRD